MYMAILWKVKNTRAACFWVNQKKNAVTLLYRFYQSAKKNKVAAAT